MSPQPGIGHYRILDKLGESGMDAVYRLVRFTREARIGHDGDGLGGGAAQP